MGELSRLSDDELLQRLDEFARNERGALAEFLAHLAEMDRRIAARKSAWPSTFAYCTKKLLYAEDEAYKRITAARAAADHPEIYTYIREGRLNISSILKLSPHLEKEDAATLLDRAAGHSVREVAEIVAPVAVGIPPAPRIVPVKRIPEPPGPLFDNQPHAEPSIAFRFSFEAPKELKELIDRSKDVLWHKYPFGQLDAILLEWGREWVARHDQLAKPTPKPPAKAAEGDRPPAWVRNVVWKRDGGRCAYIAKDGTRCETRRGLELDHIVPRSLGGDHSPENTRLLCRPHNDEERRRVLGEGEAAKPPNGGPQPGLFS